jgi:hypothetical protein
MPPLCMFAISASSSIRPLRSTDAFCAPVVTPEWCTWPASVVWSPVAASAASRAFPRSRLPMPCTSCAAPLYRARLGRDRIRYIAWWDAHLILAPRPAPADVPVVVGTPTPEAGAVVVSVVRVLVVWFMLSVVSGKTLIGVGMIWTCLIGELNSTFLVLLLEAAG